MAIADPSPADDQPGATLDPALLEEALGTVIAQRVREYRLQLGLTVGQLAVRSGLSKGMLSKMENAQASPSLATLARLSTALSVPITAFFRGLDIQHKGSRAGHRYQILGSMRGPQKRMEPVLATLMERSEVFPAYQHPGTELIYMLAGKMEYGYGSATYLLEPGDALQFNGEVTHGPTELLTLPIQFLSVKAYGAVPPD